MQYCFFPFLSILLICNFHGSFEPFLGSVFHRLLDTTSFFAVGLPGNDMEGGRDNAILYDGFFLLLVFGILNSKGQSARWGARTELWTFIQSVTLPTRTPPGMER